MSNQPPVVEANVRRGIVQLLPLAMPGPRAIYAGLPEVRGRPYSQAGFSYLALSPDRDSIPVFCQCDTMIEFVDGFALSLLNTPGTVYHVVTHDSTILTMLSTAFLRSIPAENVVNYDANRYLRVRGGELVLSSSLHMELLHHERRTGLRRAFVYDGRAPDFYLEILA